MSVGVKSYRAAGVALIGAAVVITPVRGAAVPLRAPGSAYSLTAVSTALPAGASMANVPINLFDMVMSIPAWEVQAMGRLADAMAATGSWQVWGPTNVLGFDEQDPPKLAAIVDMLIPVQPVSSVLGEQLNWWAKADLPMNAGCAAAPSACPDPRALLSASMTVPVSKLFQGYQFPVVTNPFTHQATSWSGEFVKLDPGAAMKGLLAYLTAPPVGVATVSPTEALTTTSRLGTSARDGFYPFVQNSEWFDTAHTPLAPVFRAFAPVLCKSCQANPYDNPWLANYSPTSAEGRKVADPPPIMGTPVKAAASSSDPGESAAAVTAPDRSVVNRTAKRASGPRGAGRAAQHAVGR